MRIKIIIQDRSVHYSILIDQTASELQRVYDHLLEFKVKNCPEARNLGILAAMIHHRIGGSEFDLIYLLTKGYSPECICKFQSGYFTEKDRIEESRK